MPSVAITFNGLNQKSGPYWTTKNTKNE